MKIRWSRMVWMGIALWALALLALAAWEDPTIVSRPILVQFPMPAKKADVVVAISAAIMKDCNPVDALLDRERRAAELWREGYSRSGKVIFSGVYTQVPAVSPKACHQRLARRLGVAPSALILDNHATSTYENAVNVKRLMQRRGWRNALLVTVESHMKRARWTFEKQGVPVEPATVEDRLSPGQGLLDVRRLTYLHRFLYEYVAMLRYKWYGYI